MYENLKQKGLGRFQNGVYWTSSQSNDDPENSAWIQRFNDGNQVANHRGYQNTPQGQTWYDPPASKKSANSVRPIRQF